MISVSKGQLRALRPLLCHFDVDSVKFIFQFYHGNPRRKQLFIVTRDDRVLAYGSNRDGILATGDTLQIIIAPVEVVHLTRRRIIDFTYGNGHILALTSDGDVLCWGRNDHGQLGIGNASDKYELIPQRVHFPDKIKIKQIASGDWFSVALACDSSVYTWGWNGFGQLGHGTTEDIYLPTRVIFFNNVIAVDVHTSSSNLFVRTSSGHLFSCGFNEYGTVGCGQIKDRKVTRPAMVKFNYPHTTIESSCSASNICAAIATDGALWVWGQFAQTIHTPERIPLLINEQRPVEVSWLLQAGWNIAMVTYEGEVYLIKLLEDPHNPVRLEPEDVWKSLLSRGPIKIQPIPF